MITRRPPEVIAPWLVQETDDGLRYSLLPMDYFRESDSWTRRRAGSLKEMSVRYLRAQLGIEVRN